MFAELETATAAGMLHDVSNARYWHNREGPLELRPLFRPREALARRGKMLKTKLTEDYRLAHPFISAGMAFVATVPLVRAVCAAGGMGILAVSAMPPDQMRNAIRELRDGGATAFGVDIIPRFNTLDHIDICVQEKVPVVAFFWDEAPAEWIARLRTGGCRVWVQVGSVEEAIAAVNIGAEALIAQGSEAGGHNRAVAATLSLLPAVIDAVSSVPVIAAGGIADGRAVAAVLALGAEAVWVGTRLLASDEAFAHEDYKRRVLAAKVQDTARHFIFGPEFPDASTRGLRNRLVREWEGRDIPPPYKTAPAETLPVIGEAVIFGQNVPLQRFMGFPPTPEFTGDFEEMSLLAGESVGQTTKLQSVAEIIREMMEEAEAVIKQRLCRMTS
jgi:enoyl-[acyl-carrier protein] reductase II